MKETNELFCQSYNIKVIFCASCIIFNQEYEWLIGLEIL